MHHLKQHTGLFSVRDTQNEGTSLSCSSYLISHGVSLVFPLKCKVARGSSFKEVVSSEVKMGLFPANPVWFIIGECLT